MGVLLIFKQSSAQRKRLEMNTLKWLRSVLLISIVALGISVVNFAQTPNRIVYGLTLAVSGIDPHINQSSELGIFLRQVYDTLVYRDPMSKEIVPGLAESWEISPDGLSYIFQLKQGVTFHDGTLFNAQAVAANIDRIIDPNTNSQRSRLMLGTYLDYQILSDYQIQFNFSAPYSPFLDSLSQVYLGIASPTQITAYASDPLLYQFHQIGTGPFIFVEYLPEDRIILKRNPNYTWGPEFYGELPENAVDEIEFRFFTDPVTRLVALQSGEAQIMGEILPVDARTVTAESGIQLMQVNIPGQPAQFYFNTEQAPTNRLEVRQALILGANRSAIVESVFQGFSPIAWSPITQPTLFYNPNVFGVYNYDFIRAQQLLTSAGYADSDQDGILELNGEKLSITVIQPPWGLFPQVTQLLQDQWTSLGFEVNVEPVPGFTALSEQVSTGEYNLVAFNTSGLDPAFLNSRFTSEGILNWTGYADPNLDTILTNALATTDTTQRIQLYGQAQAIILEQALILPIREQVNLNGYVNGIQGLVFDPYGWFPLLYGLSYTPVN
jgi:peptide/nickel transport system substrate-binding protein